MDAIVSRKPGRLTAAATLLVLLAGACMKAPTPPVAGGTTSRVELVFTAPPDWETQPRSMAIFLGQWSIPGDGIANVSWIPGQTGADAIAANVDRWLGQWEVPGSTPQESYELDAAQGYYPEQRIVLHGTLVSTAQLGGGDPREDWMMVASVLATPAGPVYVKLIGPRTELEPQLDTLWELIATMRVQ